MTISLDRKPEKAAILTLYHALNWSAAQKSDALYAALMNSHQLVTAWDGNRLIGLGNAISDGHLVVYYPHLLVHPDYHGKGIGKQLLVALQTVYNDFHMQILVADGKAIDFYASQGFEKAGSTQAMWKYHGKDHE